MKDFRNMNDKQLQHILAFTSALADRIEQNANFDTPDDALLDAERQAVRFAEQRNTGKTAHSDYGMSDDERAEIDSIRAQIRDYYKRTRKVVKG